MLGALPRKSGQSDRGSNSSFLFCHARERSRSGDEGRLETKEARGREASRDHTGATASRSRTPSGASVKSKPLGNGSFRNKVSDNESLPGQVDVAVGLSKYHCLAFSVAT